MLNEFYEQISVSSPTAVVIIGVSIMLFFGFLMTRVTKLLKLPNVTAYIVAGILIGPFCLDLVPSSVIAGTDFISDIALAFIAFSVGEFFKVSALRKNGVKTIGDAAFYGCTALTQIVVPDSVTSIGDGAFERCGSLERITLPFIGQSKDGTSNSYCYCHRIGTYVNIIQPCIY